MSSQARPSFFCSRPDGTLTPLIAVDDLPTHVTIHGVSRTMTAGETQGMTSCGLAPARNEPWVVEAASNAHSQTPILSHDAAIDLQLTLSNMMGDDKLAPQHRAAIQNLLYRMTEGAFYSAPHNSKLLITSRGQGAHGQRDQGGHSTGNKKQYCSYWIRHGECDYAQQGCMFKHEIPTDPVMMEKLGLRDIPRWYREKYGLPSLLPQGNTGNSNRGGYTIRPATNNATPQTGMKAIQYPLTETTDDSSTVTTNSGQQQQQPRGANNRYKPARGPGITGNKARGSNSSTWGKNMNRTGTWAQGTAANNNTNGILAQSASSKTTTTNGSWGQSTPVSTTNGTWGQSTPASTANGSWGQDTRAGNTNAPNASWAQDARAGNSNTVNDSWSQDTRAGKNNVANASWVQDTRAGNNNAANASWTRNTAASVTNTTWAQNTPTCTISAGSVPSEDSLVNIRNVNSKFDLLSTEPVPDHSSGHAPQSTMNKDGMSSNNTLQCRLRNLTNQETYNSAPGQATDKDLFRTKSRWMFDFGQDGRDGLTTQDVNEVADSTVSKPGSAQAKTTLSPIGQLVAESDPIGPDEMLLNFGAIGEPVRRPPSIQSLGGVLLPEGGTHPLSFAPLSAKSGLNPNSH